ncbi:phospho-N-acetylmuramoyl-pentapeptide-transferase [Patescibacteria group bacterium]|nr:phospho-N-acetylmuramoyl-pentapeptide-transferase [Patescibacteria group bacterium]
MNIFNQSILNTTLFFIILSGLIAFAWAPLLIHLLNKFKIKRTFEIGSAKGIGHRLEKTGTPIMGGLLIVITVLVVTVLFNWDKRFTYVPIGVMCLASLLGSWDDILNVFGKRRYVRSWYQTIKLIHLHKSILKRGWLVISLPWVIFRNTFHIFSPQPGRGVLPHEKILLQFIAGAVTAWWIVFKLGEEWLYVWIPFNGEIYLGYWMVLIIIFTVILLANAVNISDGLDGLSGGTLISAFGGLAVLSYFQGSLPFSVLNATVIGALIAYVYFNVKPARFQMGDVGSLALGSLFAVMIIAQNRLLLVPFFGFIFLAEIISVILQTFWRYGLGKRLLKMAPLHHHLELLGWCEEKIVTRFWLINMFMVILGLWLAMH